jgi:hypothetical protein
MNQQLNMKAETVIKEMRGWAKYEPKAGLVECLCEAADLMEALIEERKTFEVFISEREWLHREG